jgi:hypothetical protein
VRTAAGQVEGQAHPEASIHYWTFYEAEESLQLRFLSTFAGNQRPLLLSATEEREDGVVFQAQPCGFLEVRVKPHTNTLTMKIFLRGRPHVEIHLARR